MTTVSAPVRQEPVLATEAPRLRLEFLDGLRGMAALYVATSHAMLYYYIATDNEKLFVNPIIRKILKLAYFTLLSFGHEAVVIFYRSFRLCPHASHCKDSRRPYAQRDVGLLQATC